MISTFLTLLRLINLSLAQTLASVLHALVLGLLVLGPGPLDVVPDHLGAVPALLRLVPSHLDAVPVLLDVVPGLLVDGPVHLGAVPALLGLVPGHLDAVPGLLELVPGRLDVVPGLLAEGRVHVAAVRNLRDPDNHVRLVIALLVSVLLLDRGLNSHQ